MIPGDVCKGYEVLLNFHICFALAVYPKLEKASDYIMRERERRKGDNFFFILDQLHIFEIH